MVKGVLGRVNSEKKMPSSLDGRKVKSTRLGSGTIPVDFRKTGSQK